jgi:hypothetical protein
MDDLEEPGFRLHVAGLALDDLLLAFGAAEMLGHRGVAEQLLEQRQLVFIPRL